MDCVSCRHPIPPNDSGGIIYRVGEGYGWKCGSAGICTWCWNGLPKSEKKPEPPVNPLYPFAYAYACAKTPDTPECYVDPPH